MMALTFNSTAGDGDLSTTVVSGQLEYHLEGVNAQACVEASRNPSVHVYYALRSQLERSTTAWLQEFLSLGGLDSLLDSLCQMTGKTFLSFSDAILQIDCISCIRAILNTHLGIDCFLQAASAANKLIMGLEISNTLPKKQILEMAAALCAHSPQGYQRILEGLDHLKRLTNQYHRFSIVVNELKSAETVPHKTAVMTFINTIINCNKDLTQRCRLRNEMIGLTLLDVINFLQREETDDDLHIQLQTFHDRKHLDEDASYGKAEVDLSSPSELAEALQSRTFGTSRMVSLVNILQDLLAIELLEKNDKERLWGIVEQQVHHLVHLNHLSAGMLSSLTPHQVDDLLYEVTEITQSLESQVSKLSNTTTTHTNTSASDSNHSMYDNLNNGKNKRDYATQKGKTSEPDLLGDLNNLNNPSALQTVHGDFRLPSKQLDFPDVNVHFSRPSLPLMPMKAASAFGQLDFPDVNVHFSRPSLPLMPMKAASAFGHVTTRRDSLDGQSYQKRSKQMAFRMTPVPFPSQKMKNLKWIKLQDSIVERSKGCIWEPREAIPRVEPDYNRLEMLFAETHVVDVSDEVTLLAADTRLKISLFLNRLEVEPDELVRNLIDCEAPSLTLPLLKYLHSILPCHEEMLMLKQYNGSLLDTGMAEQFLFHLMDIPDYHTLMLGHLTRLEFSANITRLHKALKAMVSACKFVLENEQLRDILHLVLRIGNFLNQGQFNGSASGLRLSCLKRLKDVSSVEPNHTLLHQVAAVVEDSDEQMFCVLAEIPKLDQAARHSPEEIKNDVTTLNSQLKEFVVCLTSAHPNISDIFHHFLEGVKKDFSKMQQSIAELRELSNKVALYMCEPVSKFNLQACLQNVLTFLKDLRSARHENSLFRQQRTRAHRRSDQFKAKLKHKRLALEFGKDACASSSMMEDGKKVVERMLTELHHGNFNPVAPSPDLSTPEQELTPVPVVKAQRQITPKPHGNDPTTPMASKSTAPLGPPSAQRRQVLELSHISVVGTPMINRPCSEHFDDDLFHFTPRYPCQGKVMTSSVNDLLDKAPVQKQQQKPPHSVVGSHVATSPPVTQHHRSRSDLTDSTLVQNKWIKYEEMKQRENKSHDCFGAPLAVPESSLTLATLNLEDICGRHGCDPMMKLNFGPVLYVPQDSKNKKADRKSGIGGFFSRLSRAVLKPRNTTTNVEHNILQPSHSQDKGKNSQLHSDLNDKENCMNKPGDPKRSSKRSGRFRLPKYST